eukprot:221125-Pelagomonas_calceolata.AAC.5
MKEQFGNDEWGQRKAFYFFPWHFSFFHRLALGIEEALQYVLLPGLLMKKHMNHKCPNLGSTWPCVLIQNKPFPFKLGKAFGARH